MRVMKTIAIVVSICLLTDKLTGQNLPGDLSNLPTARGVLPSAPAITFEAITSHAKVQPGGKLRIAVKIAIPAGEHLYSPVPGGKIVKPVALKVHIGETFLKTYQPVFSRPVKKTTRYPNGQSDTHFVYEGACWIFIPVKVPTDARMGKVELPIVIEGQICQDNGLCQKVKGVVEPAFEIAAEAVSSAQWTDEIERIFSQARTADQYRADLLSPAEMITDWGKPAGASISIMGAFLLAILAGLALNITPCVLPVIPLRLLALLDQAGQSRRRFVSLGLAFAAGIVLYFVGLAAANVVLKATLHYSLKQADLFRHTATSMTMALLLVALAANMFGAFTVTVPGRIAGAQMRRGYLGAVGMGVLMAILSTPCSFAIIAAVLSAAVLFLPLTAGTITIILIGVGMAIPHAVLSAFPRVISRLPRAGRWSELFVQTVGFVFLLIAVWLLGTHMDKPYPVAWVAGYAVILAMCLWMWGSWVRFDTPALKKWFIRAIATGIAVSMGYLMLTPPKPLAVKMQPFDAEKIARAHREGKIVLVKFTASWCTECKFVDMRVYNSKEVAEALRRAGVVVFKGDVSRHDAPANEMLFEKLREAGPPITVIFPPADRQPIRLRGLISKDDLLKAIAQAQGKH